MVTGPYKINGVPLRRINQRYCIGTSTTVDISRVQSSLADYDDSFFKRPAKKTAKKTEDDFFAAEAEKREMKPERIAAQKKVDAPLMGAIKKTPFLKQYLNAKFSLTSGQAPHAMKF